MDEGLTGVREQLLAHRPAPLEPGEGAAAFQFHKLLATTVHQASKLDARAHDSETGAWVRYLSSYFPAGRDGEQDAKLLWVEWRTSLLKVGAPGPNLLVTHGQPKAHWLRDATGRLCLDLESMWADFAASVDAFLAFLATDHDRRKIALERSLRSAVAVEVVELVTVSVPASGWAGPLSPVAAPTASGASAIARVPPKPKRR
jgi:hypothetical protein